MPDDLSQWEQIKRLGSGGQGEVFLVRTPGRVATRAQARAQIRPSITNIRGFEGMPSEGFIQRLLDAIAECNRPDAPNELGALKRFKISPDDKGEEARAIGRLESEIRALKSVDHPAVLKLLHANVAERFIVTEYHRRGALSENLNLYRGNLLTALNAFRTVVSGVVAIHAQNAVHRDIKPANIFVTESGELVLGDFGIVFFDTGNHGRLTKTVGELVGSHWWMPPWAYTYDRIAMDKISASFDVYPLAKVLWSMISGRDGFMREEYDLDENDLAKLFPDAPGMLLINELLAKCVVRHERDCGFSNASDLLLEVDGLISKITNRRGHRPDGAEAWPCRICGKGSYRPASSPAGYPHAPIMFAQIPGGNDRRAFSISICDHCGHAELFKSYRD